ncbi:MAG: ATP-binding cassette domain-containing protein [Syntrophales bacterium]
MIKKGNGTTGQPLISIRRGAARIRDRIVLPGVSWVISTGQNWAVLGANGAGKSTLMKVLTGDVPLAGGEITHYPPVTEDSIGHVSFERHEQLIAEDELADDSRDFAGEEGFLKVRDFLLKREEVPESPPLPGGGVRRRAKRKFPDQCIREEQHADSRLRGNAFFRGENFKFHSSLFPLLSSNLLDRPLRSLSTGEIRKVLIARELARRPRILILDEPFDGLDEGSSRELAALLEGLMQKGLPVILVSNRRDEILPGITHILLLGKGRILFKGEKGGALRRCGMKQGSRPPKIREFFFSNARKKAGREAKRPLVEIINTTVQYNGVAVLDRLNWTVKPAENWAVTGPNGSGKSTLLALISGDHLQAYANEIYLFGRRRGSGESIWDIKSRIGMVSSEFQVRYRKPLSVFEAVASGFFDSVGLYRDVDAGRRRRVRECLDTFGLAGYADNMFNRLSYGERRMVLLARAMVKCPELLLLDEPCQGLDEKHRRLLLDMVDYIGTATDTCMIYVTHRRDEIPPCVDHELRLKSRG